MVAMAPTIIPVEDGNSSRSRKKVMKLLPIGSEFRARFSPEFKILTLTVTLMMNLINFSNVVINLI